MSYKTTTYCGDMPVTNGASQLHSQSSGATKGIARSIRRFRREYDPTLACGRIKFYEMLGGGLVVPAPLLVSIRRRVSEFMLFLEQGAVYSATDLVGLDFVQVLNSGERRVLDPCIRTLIGQGLPFREVKAAPSGQSTYQFLGIAPK